MMTMIVVTACDGGCGGGIRNGGNGNDDGDDGDDGNDLTVMTLDNDDDELIDDGCR